MAPDDARGGTRHIGQNAVEGAVERIVPLRGGAGIADAYLSVQPEPLQVFADTACTARVAFKRNQLEIGQLEQMTRLSAGRSAGVQHTHAVARAEPLGGELRAGVLHRHDAVVKAGDAVDRHRRGQAHGVVAGAGSVDMVVLQDLQIGVDRRVARVDTQRQRPLRVAGCKYVLPVVGPRFAYRVDPPGRVVPARNFVVLGCGEERVPLAQEAAQHGVDETLCKRELAARGNRVDGLIDDGER